MTSTLVTGIAELATCDEDLADADQSAGLGRMERAAVVVEGGTVVWVGPAGAPPPTDQMVDVEGRAVIPGFVDSHTHLVFAGDRSAEFAARMSGVPYDGGGIASTVAATLATGDDELRALLAVRVHDARRLGTTTLEIKSGYGLGTDAEARLLRLAREFTDETTYLGAHVVPSEFRERSGHRQHAGDRDTYVDLVTGPMLEACAPYARWVDVFCEPHSTYAFTADEARRVLLAGKAAGLGLRVHGNQLGLGPGVQLAVELEAASVDHCTYLAAADLDALSGAAATTTATLLPGVEFSTRSPYPDGRALLDAGVSVALASDCNPGTHYSSSMPFVIALAVREMGLTTAEALRAATVGGAKSLRRNDIGRIRVGGRAHLTVLDAPSYLHLSYRPGMPIARVLDLP